MGRQTLLALDEPFLPTPVRSEPRVWLKNVRICASPERELRRLELAPGLNVVWAPDAEPEERVGTRIGHGAGKTLLCRFLRHVLGESDLASPGDAEALRGSFPKGFVDAEVHIDGSRWAVRRAIAPDAEAIAVQGGDLAALDDSSQRVPYETFVEALRATLGASATTISNDPWLTSLAWMSRDQERRFGGPLSWRDRAASPNSKVARVANLERVRAIRSLLQLRADDDLVAEGRVAALEQDERLTIRQLADCEREVTWLSIRLAREGIGDASELAGQPLALRAAIVELTSTLETLDAPREEPPAVADVRRAYEEALRNEAVAAAMLARCEAELAELRGVTSPDPKAITRAERESSKLAKAHARSERALARARRKLAVALERDRARMQVERREWADARDRVARARELERQVQRRDELQARLARVQHELAEARAERERVSKEHGKSVRRVSEVFDFVVRRLAGQDVSGRLRIGATELDASIRLPDGRRGTSPALRVLETLALDLSALVLACEDRSDLPGLLIHDSPREADLARSHYDALYRLATWLEDATPTPGFQYIVTTTTSPPSSTAFRALRLGAASNEELLLRTALTG